MAEESAHVNEDGRYRGCVKWFNPRLNHGRITFVVGAAGAAEAYVHLSHIVLEGGEGTPVVNHARLTGGERVTFDLELTPDQVCAYTARNVRGPRNGRLLCEIHRRRHHHVKYRR